MASVARVTGAGSVFALLMERDTVLVKRGTDAEGHEHHPAQESVKRAARLSLAALRAHAEDHEETGALQRRVEREGATTFLPFVVTDSITGTVIIEPGARSLDERALALATAFTTIAARLHALAEENAGLRRRVEHAEKRIDSVEQSAASGGVGAVKYLKPVAELERDAIELALRTTGWNKEEAARRLGISRASIYMKVKKHGLQKPLP